KIMEDDFKALGDSLASLYASNPDLAAKRFQELLDATGLSAEDLLELMPGYALALEQGADAADGAADAAEGFADATAGATGSVGEHVDAMWEMTQAHLDAANSVLDARSAERRFQEAIDAATTSLDENGKTLDVTTEKGRANEAALDDIAISGWAWIESLKEQGSTNEELQGVMETTRTKFIDTATQMGMTKGE